jgi:hypothetical protein
VKDMAKNTKLTNNQSEKKNNIKCLLKHGGVKSLFGPYSSAW